MALIALVDVNDETVWRVSFATVAILGALAIATLTRAGPSRRSDNRLATAGLLLAVARYALVAVVAIAPGALSGLGISLSALRAEGILLAVLLFLGVNVAWMLLFDEVTPD